MDTVDSTGENQATRCLREESLVYVSSQVDIAGTLTKLNLDINGAPSKGDPVAKQGERSCPVLRVCFGQSDVLSMSYNPTRQWIS